MGRGRRGIENRSVRAPATGAQGPTYLEGQIRTPMIAVAGEADSVVAARFSIRRSTVSAKHRGKRLVVLDRVGKGWHFSGTFGAGLVPAPRFVGDLGSSIRVMLAGQMLAQSVDGFVLELEDGLAVLRKLSERSEVAREVAGVWVAGQISAAELELDGAIG